MTARFDYHEGILLELYYTQEGKCYAACENPIGYLGTWESERFDNPSEAFENLKNKIDSQRKAYEVNLKPIYDISKHQDTRFYRDEI